MTKEQKCIADLYTLLRRIENNAHRGDLSLVRIPHGPSGCDKYQGEPPMTRIMDEFWRKYGAVISEALIKDEERNGARENQTI